MPLECEGCRKQFASIDALSSNETGVECAKLWKERRVLVQWRDGEECGEYVGWYNYDMTGAIVALGMPGAVTITNASCQS